MPYAGVLSLNDTESMKESEIQITRDFRTVFGRVSDVKESVSESGLKEQMH